MKNIKDYSWLPIGSVVKLKKVEKLVMIYGRHQIQSSSKERFDYVSVPYPEGNITEEFNLFFNQNMIEKVLFKGFINDEEMIIKDKLNEKRKESLDNNEV